MSNFQALEVVDRVSETQPQVVVFQVIKNICFFLQDMVKDKRHIGNIDKLNRRPLLNIIN